MRGAALALLAALASTSAAALTCDYTSPDTAFDRAALSRSEYTLVLGQAQFDEKLLPHNRAQPPDSTEIPARITGRALNANGFVSPFRRAITLDARCLGPDCGTLVAGETYLMFLERRDAGYTLTLDPCAEYVFARPNAETLNHIAACFQLGGQCAPRRKR